MADSPAVFHLSEIRRQLEILGYRDVPEAKLREYKAELDALASRGGDGGDDVDDDSASLATESTATPLGGRLVRRKTARRLPDGGRAVVRESCQSSLAGDDQSLDGSEYADYRRRIPAAPEGGERPEPPQPQRRAAPRQLIRPTPRGAIDGLGFRRSDPVRRYHQYAALWAAQGPTPGETQHKALRWAVREHLAEAQVPAGPPPLPPPGGRAAAAASARGAPEDRAAALRDEIRRELASYGFN